MAYRHDLDAVFQALADPTRRAVIHALAAGPRSVGALADGFPMALPSFMKHVRILEDSGWITTRKAGRVRTCVLEPAAFQAAADFLARERALWEARTDRLEALVTALSREDPS